MRLLSNIAKTIYPAISARNFAVAGMVSRIIPTTTTTTTTTLRSSTSSSTENKAENSDSNSNSITAAEEYSPAKVWTYQGTSGSKMTMNRPDSGSRFEKKLPIGKHPIQLYSLATPNGQKVTIMLEELIEAGGVSADLDYDAWYINIMELDQFGSEFVDVNPNSKIPAMRVYDDNGMDKEPLKLFESASIVLYLAEKYGKFLPTESIEKKITTMNWVFWLHGSAPYLGGGFGHFYHYADTKQEYPIERFTMETKRQLDVLEKNLIGKKYMIGDEYTIADITIWPWYGNLVLGRLYGDAVTFLNVEKDYPNVLRWAKDLNTRPGIQRGRLVNSFSSDEEGLKNRHSTSDFDGIDWKNASKL